MIPSLSIGPRTLLNDCNHSATAIFWRSAILNITRLKEQRVSRRSTSIFHISSETRTSRFGPLFSKADPRRCEIIWSRHAQRQSRWIWRSAPLIGMHSGVRNPPTVVLLSARGSRASLREQLVRRRTATQVCRASVGPRGSHIAGIRGTRRHRPEKVPSGGVGSGRSLRHGNWRVLRAVSGGQDA